MVFPLEVPEKGSSGDLRLALYLLEAGRGTNSMAAETDWFVVLAPVEQQCCQLFATLAEDNVMSPAADPVLTAAANGTLPVDIRGLALFVGCNSCTERISRSTNGSQRFSACTRSFYSLNGQP